MRISLLILLLFSTTLLADNYEAGKTLYFQKGCNNCHGIKAEGSSYYPALANKKKKYLKEKLISFQKGEASSQKAEIMFTFANTLTVDDIDNICTFLTDHHEAKNTDYEISDDLLGGTN